MHLAIFLDSHAVAGDESLLEEARDYLDRILAGSDSFLARFAGAIMLFDDSPSWWQRLTSKRDDQPIDLKLGTFPIVHGARAWRSSSTCAPRAPRRACACWWKRT